MEKTTNSLAPWSSEFPNILSMKCKVEKKNQNKNNADNTKNNQLAGKIKLSLKSKEHSSMTDEAENEETPKLDSEKTPTIKLTNELRESNSGKSTKSLLKEKDKILMDYVKDSGLGINEVHQAIQGFKQLNNGYHSKIPVNRMTSRYNDTPAIENTKEITAIKSKDSLNEKLRREKEFVKIEQKEKKPQINERANKVEQFVSSNKVIIMEGSNTDNDAKRVSLIRKDVLNKLIQKIDYYDNQIESNTKCSGDQKPNDLVSGSNNLAQRISVSTDKVSECNFRNDSIIKARNIRTNNEVADLANQQIVSNPIDSDCDSENDSYESFDNDIKNSNYNCNEQNVNNSESEFNCESNNISKYKAKSSLGKHKNKHKNSKGASKRSGKSNEHLRSKRKGLRKTVFKK